MVFSSTFLITSSGLFDFDLTFPTEALLFLLLSTVITFVFLSPISSQLEERASFLEYTIKKSIIFLTFGYEQLGNSVNLVVQEVNELTRQEKVIKTSSTNSFEKEISFIQKENGKLLNEIKQTLVFRSAALFGSITPEIEKIAESFFKKKFQST
jgi:hypothetical protein